MVVVLVVTVCGVFAACGEPTKISDLYEDGAYDSATEITQSYAWDKIYKGIGGLLGDGGDASFLNFDTTFYFTFLKDSVGSKYFINTQGSIDVYDNEQSKFLFELGSTDQNGENKKIIIGVYYFDGNLYADLRTLFGGIHVLKADDVDLTKLVKLIQSITGSLDLSGTLDDLLSTPILGQPLSNFIPAMLFGKSHLVSLGAGKERVRVELALNTLLPTLLGIVQGMLADYQDILEVVRDITGLDLTNLSALIPNLEATIEADFDNSVLSGVNLDAAIDYGKGSVPEDVAIELGFNSASVDGIQKVVLPDYIENAEMKDFSFTTLSLDASVSVSTTEKDITIGGIVDSLGALLAGVMSDKIEDLIKDKTISFEPAIYKLEMSLRAELDFKDNAKTNVFFELYGGSNRTVRLGLYYVGASETLYLDLQGILGQGSKYKLQNFDLIATIDDAIEGLVAGIGSSGEAEGAAGVTSLSEKMAYLVSEYVDVNMADGNVMPKAEVYSLVKNMILNGEVFTRHTLVNEAQTAADSTDYMAIISEILSNLEVVMGEGGWLSLERFSLVIGQETLNSIVSIFAPDSTLPIKSAEVVLNNRTESDNFARNNLTFTVNMADPFDGFMLKAVAELTYGTVTQLQNVIDMSEALAKVEADSANYLNYERDENGNFSIGKLYVSLKGELDLYTSNGDFTTIQYRDVTSASTLLLQVLMHLDNTTQAKLYFNIEGNIDFANFLESELCFTVVDADGTEYLELYYINKVLYIDLSYFNIQKVKVDLSDFIEKEEVSNEAVGSDETTDGESSGVDIVAIIAAMISGVDIGSETLSLYLAGSLVSNLIAALELDDKLVVGDMDSINGGIRIALADGLNLNELQIDIFLASGNRFDMNFGLSDFTIKAATEQFLTPDYEKIEDLDSYTGTRFTKRADTSTLWKIPISRSP